MLDGQVIAKQNTMQSVIETLEASGTCSPVCPLAEKKPGLELLLTVKSLGKKARESTSLLCGNAIEISVDVQP